MPEPSLDWWIALAPHIGLALAIAIGLLVRWWLR